MENQVYDAVVVPGGGVDSEKGVPEWVQRRLEQALAYRESRYFLLLSGGTHHKPQPRDREGYVLFESQAAGGYLLERGVPEEKILLEAASYDTIGNAYFAKVIHIDPLGLRNLKVITSAFHMPRTRAIFEFVFSERFSSHPYQLSFESVSDEGIDPELMAERYKREAASLARFQARSSRVETLADLHRWLFIEHDAYRVSGAREALNPTLLAGY